MIKISKKILPTVKDLQKFDEYLGKKLKKIDEEENCCIHMASLELLENAVKHHVSHNLDKVIFFDLTIDEIVRINVTNQLNSPIDAEILIKHIDDLNSGIDPRTQYVCRLKEIMEYRIPNESKLGLLRIAGEGNFGLKYELGTNLITVHVFKDYVKKRKKVMESLTTKDFSIIVNEGDPYKVCWTGRSRNLNPSLLIDEYLYELSNYLVNRDAVIDFSKMEALNSSTIPPILSFFTNLEKKRIHPTVQYSNDIHWQRASFKPLSVLTRDFTFVKIIPV
jgi:hypothetical protein